MISLFNIFQSSALWKVTTHSKKKKKYIYNINLIINNILKDTNVINSENT